MEWVAKIRRMWGNDGTARGDSSAQTSTEGREVATSSGYDYEVFSSFRGPDTQAEGQEVATSSGYDYEVFLSFRGPDTRAGFTDFLYTSLKDAGIHTFKDDEDLRKGVEFAPELLQAIKQSKILIPIFSKGYASSVWCLKEVVQMVKCQKNGRQKIMPIFYDVEPSEVRHQLRNYKKSLLLHESKKRYDQKTIGEWKDALHVVAEINGWELPRDPTSRRESKFVKEFTQKIFNELKKASLALSNNLVSVDHHVEEIMEKIGAQTSETRIIGIHGMGGIGKTTLAKIIYNQLSEKFNNCCFLVNIREQAETNNGIISLQKKLILEVLKKKLTNIRDVDEGIQKIRKELSNEKVLVVLDDVDHKKHMDALVGNHNWFGKGSKLIITTRKKEVLEVANVDDLYEVDIMDSEKSLQLFSKHAFRRDYPLDKDINQSMRAIKIAGGLPLALEVMGSFLSCFERKKWNSKLAKLESVPHADVRSKLKISYDVLEDGEKHIFLDIACLLIGYDKDIIVHFWESKIYPECAMDVLESMSLIKIEENKVWMHDQLKALGRDLVQQINIKEKTRVWNVEEALELIKRQEEKRKVEALCLKCDHQHQYCCTFEDFKRLPNLRFLEVDGWTENSNPKRRRHFSKTNVFQENSLLPKLRWLSWHDIPPTFNITNFSMENIVIVDLSFGKFTHDWDGWSYMEVIKNLKVLNLTNCWYLERTPNFSAHASLECLILRSCSKLVEIDRSICRLRKLGSLDVTYCSDLQRLPDEIGGLEALKELRIDWTKIEEIPNCQGMRNLRIFTASGCRITTLPLSVGDLTSLQYVYLKGCQRLEELPDSIGYCESLIELNISWTKIKKLPDSMGRLKNLKLLKMTGSYISNIPDTLWTVEKLEEITATDNRFLHLKIDNCICRNQSLRILRLKCAEICTIPRLPESLTNLYLSKLDMMTFPDLSNLINLKELDLRFGPRHHDVKSNGLVGDLMPWWIRKLSKLQYLGLECDYVIALPTYINLLPQLKTLDLHCSNLSCLPRLPSSLSSLSVNNCMSLCLMDLSNLKKLSSLRICSSQISEIQGLGCLGNLKKLRIFDLGQVDILPDLSDLNQLRSLQVQSCGNLVEIQGELPHSLEELEICLCEYLQELPDLSSLKRLQKIVIEDCMKVNVEAILGIAQRSQANFWENLQKLQISDLQQVEKLPDLSNLNKLSSLDVQRCGNLMEIQGKLPQSLEKLLIHSCESLQKLPDLSSLNRLQSPDIKDCPKLNVEAILVSALRNHKRSATGSRKLLDP